VPLGLIFRRTRTAALGLIAATFVTALSSVASAEALLLADAASGKVLHAENATYPWYPASLTKLMTAYVTLRAVSEGRLALNSPVTMSERAHAEKPSKMGFRPGTQFTIDNGIKMLMVKSANDVAVALAETVSGSVESFAGEMNAAAQRLGMTQSNWVNPNGMPDPGQISSARDLAILARALLREFPQHDLYWRIPAIKFGRKILRNHNKLIDRYTGSDGMKTGFICASGFNLVASATRNGRRLIAVVLGAPSSPVRNEKAARLLEGGFNNSGTLSWLTPSLGQVDSLTPIAAAPPNLYDDTCGPNRRRPAAEESEEEVAHNTDSETANGILMWTLQSSKAIALIGPPVQSMPPIVVTAIGPKGAPVEAAAAPAQKRKAGKKRTETARANPNAAKPGTAATLAGTAAKPSAESNTRSAGSTSTQNGKAAPKPRPQAAAKPKAKKPQ
jgi:D-alanyl-D-alanine carboxypeptidase